MYVFMLRQGHEFVAYRGVDNDIWEWISAVDQWNKATHVNLVASRVHEENSTRSMTKLLIGSERLTVDRLYCLTVSLT